jgi:hypothetical protein
MVVGVVGVAFPFGLDWGAHVPAVELPGTKIAADFPVAPRSTHFPSSLTAFGPVTQSLAAAVIDPVQVPPCGAAHVHSQSRASLKPA